jgi:hypothetical protein
MNGQDQCPVKPISFHQFPIQSKTDKFLLESLSVREIECVHRAAVLIEPGLRRQSLQNGNIRGRGRRLSPIGALRLPIWESRDKNE